MSAMQIFVSHTHTDNLFCRQLTNALREAGADVWYDEHNLGSGQLGPTIERQLELRPVFIVILSPAAVNSQWVEEECRMAHYLRRKDSSRLILPVLAEAVAEDAIWLFLREYKRVEGPGGNAYPAEEAIQRTLFSLALTTPTDHTYTNDADAVADLIARGDTLRDAQRYQEALPYYEKAIALSSDSSSAWFGYAYALNELERYPQALEAYDRCLALDPEDSGSLNNKANILKRLQRFDEAIEIYDRAIALNPDDVMFWTNRGNTLYSLERYQDALASYNRALEIDASYVQAADGRSDATKRISALLDNLATEHIISDENKSASDWYDIGEILRKLQRYTEAITSYQKAIRQGTDVRFFIGLGNTYAALGKYADALTMYDRGLNLDLQNIVLGDRRAAMLRKLGRTEEANEAVAIAQGRKKPTVKPAMPPATSSAPARVSSPPLTTTSTLQSSQSGYSPTTPSSSSYRPYTLPSATATSTARGTSLNGFAVACIVFAFLNLFAPIYPAIAGIICGHIALYQLGRNYQKGRGWAILGLVVNYLVVVVVVVRIFTS